MGQGVEVRLTGQLELNLIEFYSFFCFRGVVAIGIDQNHQYNLF